MMDGGMGSMMAWMMGIDLLGWVLVIALLVSIVVLLMRILTRQDQSGERGSSGSDSSSGGSKLS